MSVFGTVQDICMQILTNVLMRRLGYCTQRHCQLYDNTGLSLGLGHVAQGLFVCRIERHFVPLRNLCSFWIVH